MDVTGERRTSGYVYRAVVRLHEGAGVTATIASVDLTFMNGTTGVVSSHHDQPISDSSNVCPASGSVATRELVTVDAESSHPYATTVQATVTYTDGASLQASVTGSAEVPALPLRLVA